ncbi:MAG TPA: hypothetical protein VMZ33_00710 [Candidatus Limnocylindrales bacterium]|nr:hypothetical protein [Candidatus Limnocylindrales bacterium]
MARIGNACPVCSRSLVSSRFDATFRLPEGDERLFFGIPASLCQVCQQLYLDADLIDLLEVPEGRCTFAIESDQVLTREAWPGPAY